MSEDPVKMADDFAVAETNRDIDEREQRIRERLAAATPGPWRWDGQRNLTAYEAPDGEFVLGLTYGAPFIFTVPDRRLNRMVGLSPSHPNAALISDAPADLAYLLDALAAAREENGRLRTEVGRWLRQGHADTVYLNGPLLTKADAPELHRLRAELDAREATDADR